MRFVEDLHNAELLRILANMVPQLPRPSMEIHDLTVHLETCETVYHDELTNHELANIVWGARETFVGWNQRPHMNDDDNDH